MIDGNKIPAAQPAAPNAVIFWAPAQGRRAEGWFLVIGDSTMIPVDSRDPTLTDPELTEIVLHHAREQGVTLTEQQIKVSRERAPNIERLAIVRAGNITGAGLSNASVTIELLRSQGRVAMAFWHNENGGDASALLAVFRMDAEQSRVLARMIEGRI